MFYHDLKRATSHIQHLLKRASGLNSHVRYDTRWHSSKADDSGCHDKEFDIMVIT